jgi:integration host factor subunit alpha
MVKKAENPGKRGRKSTKNADSSPTITRSDLINKISQSSDINRLLIAEILKETLKEISGSLAQAEAVKISSFGTFTVLKKNERIGRNPRTGIEAKITPRQVVSFGASPIFKKSVSNS